MFDVVDGTLKIAVALLSQLNGALPEALRVIIGAFLG